MSTKELLNKIKRFLPNNTSNKLLRSDLLYIEKGTIMYVRFKGLYCLFRKLHENENFSEVYQEVFDSLISAFLKVIYQNGGVFLKFDTERLSIFFDESLMEKSSEDALLQAINCSFELVEAYNKELDKINDSYRCDPEKFISIGLTSGSVIDMIIGNEKRKERILLGPKVKRSVELSYTGKNGDVLMDVESANLIKKHITGSKRGDIYQVKELKTPIENFRLPQDNYLNLKTSIIKSFMPSHLFVELKKDPYVDFRSHKKGYVVNIELQGIHVAAADFLEKFPKITDESEKKVYADEFYFGLNKLFKKICRVTLSFDGSVNRVDLSNFGLRILLTFSFPKTYENDDHNKILCIEEASKIVSSFKNFTHKIVHFEDKMFSSIVGNEYRANYIISSPLFEKIDNVIESLEDFCVQELSYETELDDCVKMSKKKKERRGRPKAEKSETAKPKEKINLKGLHQHKVIGRNKEIITLNQLFREGGKIITLSGDYGCGKTRIVEEIVRRMQNENFFVIQMKVETRDNIIDIFTYLIEENAGIDFFDNENQIREKLKSYFDDLLTHSPDPEEIKLFKNKLFILYKILFNIDIENSSYEDLSPKLRHENLKEALSLFLIFVFYKYNKNHKGVIFIFDDFDNLKHEEKDLLQFIIQYTISHLVEKGNRRNKKSDINKISFMVTHHEVEDLEFNKLLKPVNIDLTALKKDTMKELLYEITNGKKLPSEIEKVLLKRSGGNPFFLEQYFRFIFSNGMINETETELEKTKLYKKKGIPEDIRSVVKSNLETLTPETLKFLEAASVIGVKFDIDIVKKYYADFDDKTLKEVLESNFVKKYYDKKHLYIFSHPIISDVLYEMGTNDDRLLWHRKVGELLEKTYEDTKISHPNWLGYHYNRAENNEKAKDYLKMAYDIAMRKNFVEAGYKNLCEYISFFDEGLEKDKLLVEKMELLYHMDNLKAARRIQNQLKEKYEDSDNQNFLFNLLIKVFDLTFDISPLPKLTENMKSLATVLRKINATDRQKGHYYKYYGFLKLKEGKQADAIKYLKMGINYSNSAGDFRNVCKLGNKLGEIYESSFRFNLSIDTFIRALGVAEKIKSLSNQSIILGNLGKLHYKIGKIRDSIHYYDKALDITSILSLKDVEGILAAQLGNIFLEIRDLTSAQIYMERSIKIFRALSNFEEISYRLSDFGECYIYQNNLIEAEKSFNKAYKSAKEANSSLARAYALINIGRLHTLKKNYERAEKSLKEAIKIYREKKLYKRTGMSYYYLAEMFYKEIVDFEEDPFAKYKQEKLENIDNVIKYNDLSLVYSKKAKNIHFTAKSYLLAGRILNRKERFSDAIKDLQKGLDALKVADYSPIYIDLINELAVAYVGINRNKDAVKVLKTAYKVAKKNKDIKATVKIDKMLEDINKTAG